MGIKKGSAITRGCRQRKHLPYPIAGVGCGGLDWSFSRGCTAISTESPARRSSESFHGSPPGRGGDGSNSPARRLRQAFAAERVRPLLKGQVCHRHHASPLFGRAAYVAYTGPMFRDTRRVCQGRLRSTEKTYVSPNRGSVVAGPCRQRCASNSTLWPSCYPGPIYVSAWLFGLRNLSYHGGVMSGGLVLVKLFSVLELCDHLGDTGTSVVVALVHSSEAVGKHVDHSGPRLGGLVCSRRTTSISKSPNECEQGQAF